MANKRILRVSVEVNTILTNEELGEKKQSLRTYAKELFDSEDVKIKLIYEEVEANEI